MKYPWIAEFLLSKAGVTKDRQAEWNWIRYMIGGKMFVAVCLDETDTPYYITHKLDPLKEICQGRSMKILFLATI